MGDVTTLVIPDVSGLDLPAAAVAYAEAGWRVGPLWWVREDGTCACASPRCRPPRPGQTPHRQPGIVPHGLRDFSAHTEQVAGWWRRYPQANIGLLPPPGYFGLDVDDPTQWQARGPALPRVGPVQLTGSGGGRRQHLYHLDGHAPDEVAFNKPLAGYGVETKGDGDGYLVVAPSVTSQPYRWVRTGAVPVVPDALWAILPRTTERASGPTIAIEDCCVVPARIERHPGGYDWLLKRAGHLRAAHRLTGPAARAVLLTALPAMDPPYPPGDGEAEIDRILAYDAAHPERIQAGGRGHATATPDPGPGIDAADLLALDLPPLRMVVPDLLPEGTTVLAAPPKVGKSCLVYQIAVEVALGGSLFGRRVEPGSALYLALEDGHRRGQERLRAALGATRRSAPAWMVCTNSTRCSDSAVAVWELSSRKSPKCSPGPFSKRRPT